MHPEFVLLYKIQNGELSAIIHSYLVNCTRYLDHYYKTKCEVSGDYTP